MGWSVWMWFNQAKLKNPNTFEEDWNQYKDKDWFKDFNDFFADEDGCLDCEGDVDYRDAGAIGMLRALEHLVESGEIWFKDGEGTTGMRMLGGRFFDLEEIRILEAPSVSYSGDEFKPTKEYITEKLKEYYDASNRIISILHGLPRWNTSCNCDVEGSEEDIDNPEPFYLDDGRVGEGIVTRYCMVCGGYDDR